MGAPSREDKEPLQQQRALHWKAFVSESLLGPFPPAGGRFYAHGGLVSIIFKSRLRRQYYSTTCMCSDSGAPPSHLIRLFVASFGRLEEQLLPSLGRVPTDRRVGAGERS